VHRSAWIRRGAEASPLSRVVREPPRPQGDNGGFFGSAQTLSTTCVLIPGHRIDPSTAVGRLPVALPELAPGSGEGRKAVHDFHGIGGVQVAPLRKVVRRAVRM